MSVVDNCNSAINITDSEQANYSAEDLIAHIPFLRRYARALVHNKSDADDLVQDCLVRGISRIHLFRPGTSLKAWLFSILHNLFIDNTRKIKRVREYAVDQTLMADRSIIHPNQLHRIELLEVDKALSRLPAAQRDTILMIFYQRLNYTEAAEVSGVPVGTIRSRLSRGRSTLTALLSGETPCHQKMTFNDSCQPTALVA